MESTNITRKEVIQIVFLIVLIIAVGALIFTTVTIIKYSDMLSNPIGYNLAKFGIDSCSYYDSGGNLVIIDAIK